MYRCNCGAPPNLRHVLYECWGCGRRMANLRAFVDEVCGCNIFALLHRFCSCDVPTPILASKLFDNQPPQPFLVGRRGPGLASDCHQTAPVWALTTPSPSCHHLHHHHHHPWHKDQGEVPESGIGRNNSHHCHQHHHSQGTANCPRCQDRSGLKKKK